MLKSVQWDTYTIVMVVMVPVMLLAAWGLSARDSERLHETQCEMAVSWLETSIAIAPQFEQANTLGRTQLWISALEDIDSPNAAGSLRSGIVQSAKYHQKYKANVQTSVPAVLNPRNGLFEQQIEDGKARLIAHCPETEDMIPLAFPMIAREDAS